MSSSSIFGHKISNLVFGYFTYSEYRSRPSASRKINDIGESPSVNRSTDFVPTPLLCKKSTIMSPTLSWPHSLTYSTGTPARLKEAAMFAIRPPT